MSRDDDVPADAALPFTELTSQSRGGMYIDFGDGRGAVHESDLTKADRITCGLDAPEVPNPAQVQPPKPAKRELNDG